MDNFKIVKLESERHFVKRYDDLIKSYLTFGDWASDAKGKFYEIRNILTELQFSQYQIILGLNILQMKVNRWKLFKLSK